MSENSEPRLFRKPCRYGVLRPDENRKQTKPSGESSGLTRVRPSLCYHSLPISLSLSCTAAASSASSNNLMTLALHVNKRNAKQDENEEEGIKCNYCKGFNNAMVLITERRAKAHHIGGSNSGQAPPDSVSGVHTCALSSGGVCKSHDEGD